MTHWFALLVLGSSLVAMPSRAAELLIPSRIEAFSQRDLGGQPLPSYQSGHVCSANSSMSAFWIDHVTEGPQVEQSIHLPDSFQHRVEAVAVSFDKRIAVSAGAIDRDGRVSSVLAWFGMDGSLTRVVRTWPFTAAELGFTADGSLWAIGIEKLEDLTEKPVHDVMRQYDADGNLVRSLLSRTGLSTASRHPIERALLLTSRHYAAVVSPHASSWTLVSTQGSVVSEGSLKLPKGFEIVLGGVTDSGRLFVEGQWEDVSLRGSYPPITVFEVQSASGYLEPLATGAALPAEAFGKLLGSEGEDLVFHVSERGRDSRLVWAGVR